MKIALLYLFVLLLSGCISSPKIKYVKLKPKIQETVIAPLSATELKLLKHFGGKLTEKNNIQIDDIIIHRREKTISFPAYINMISGDIEVLIATQNGLLHEALFQTTTSPFKLQLVLYLLGLNNGAYLKSKNISQGTRVKVEIEYNNKRIPLQDFVFNKHKNSLLKYNQFTFVGSNYNSAGQCLAEEQGNLIDLNSIRNTDTIIGLPPYKDIALGYFTVNTNTFLKFGSKTNIKQGSIVNVFITPIN